ncbi:hypothetical protein ONV78_11645 [Hahella sp. CR1]|uniref:hypothetical protein n=1 Tax=Hahella sp. CR1 TaxID=2992807 RepID=UPI002441856E|nr:hypothetical protein [Hahella sp. CR1]MDG9668389.1 hypothetical protein [Hahella sp. CR1]
MHPDSVASYGDSIGITIKPKTVIVEGTSDVELLNFAAKLEFNSSGTDLLGEELAIVAAGTGDRGGVSGVVRELICFRGLARTSLRSDGVPKYRFMGLFDNDHAGRQAVKSICRIDSGVVEYKDVIRLFPVMPLQANLDPTTVKNSFERANEKYRALDWELEDLIPASILSAFFDEYPSACMRSIEKLGFTHRDYTRDGKALLHRYIKEYAVIKDLELVVSLLKFIRNIMNVR